MHFYTPLVEWYTARPFFNMLLLLMVFDQISGLMLSVTKGRISSRTSWRGICKKAYTVLIVLAVGVAETYDTNYAGTAKWVSSWFCVTELISILENAVMAGVPLPSILVSMLKLRQKQLSERKENNPDDQPDKFIEAIAPTEPVPPINGQQSDTTTTKYET